jgi:hypothetical protein
MTYDASGLGNSGILVHSPTWITGQVGKFALWLNPSPDDNDNDEPHVVIGRHFDVPTLPFTLTAWINPANFTHWRAIFSKRDSYDPSLMRFDIGLTQGTGNVYLTTCTDTVTFNYAPPINTWTHIAVVATATETRLYVNGVLKQGGFGPVRLGTNALANTAIGGTGEGVGGDHDSFNGSIDEVRVYNRALSDSEIQLAYTNR